MVARKGGNYPGCLTGLRIAREIRVTCEKCGKEGPAGGMQAHFKFCGRSDELLWARIDKRGPDECWVYSGATDRRGYGRPGTETKRYYAHRRSYEMHRGPIPEGMLVLHTCDNPPCCNPAHLFLGTDADNSADRAKKLRVHNSKLDPDKVREIRKLLAAGEYQNAIAAKFNVSESVIWRIKKGDIWQHVT